MNTHQKKQLRSTSISNLIAPKIMKAFFTMTKVILILITLGCSHKSFSQAPTIACGTPATLLTVGGTCGSGTITDATVADAPAPSCGTATRDGWYRFVATATSHTVTAVTTNRQLLLQAFSGACGSLTEIGCANSNTTVGAQTEVLSLSGLTIGNTYYIRVVCETNSNMTLTSLCVKNSCSHILRLSDSYSDGWAGTPPGAITLTVNGVPVFSNLTIVDPAGPEDYTFLAATGDVINITRVADGDYPSEMEVAILGPGGFTILATQTPEAAPGTNVTGCCTQVSPSCASSPVPANNATNIDACGLTLSWTAPTSSSCSNPSSYDVYLGTSASPAFYANVTTTSYTVASGLSDNTIYYWKIVPRNIGGEASSCTIWSFTTGTSTTQYFCLNGDAVGLPSAGTNCVQMTDDVTDGFGCSWNRTMVSFSNPIDYTVNMYFGNDPTGGDGCAFVFQNSPEGTTACGTNGRELGAGGILNSLIIEFDTYDNDNPAHIIDIAADHTAVEIDGDLSNGAPFCGPVQADPADALLDDGTVYALRITWNPVTQNLSIYVSGSLRLTCNYDFITNVFGGNPNVWWGFTASTGANSNQQYYCPINMALPVEIYSLSSFCENNKPSIQWVTATETNNDYFTIERSFDGVEYELAAIVDGAGNSNSRREYLFQDHQAYSGECYYRLSQTDFDGTNKLIDVLLSNCLVESELSIINISSSGHNTATDVEFTTQISGKHQIEVIDVQGKRVYSDAFEVEKGSQHYLIPAEVNLPKVYFLKIYSGSAITTKKVAKP